MLRVGREYGAVEFQLIVEADKLPGLEVQQDVAVALDELGAAAHADISQ